MIAVLCTAEKSLYRSLPNLDLWPVSRNAWNFNSDYPVIAHPPCPQWSRLKGLASEDEEQKALAFHCLHKVFSNGGILEHPEGSAFFNAAGIRPTHSINQSWFGYPIPKRTWLFCYKVKLLPTPLSFELPSRNFHNLTKRQRSEGTHQLCQWLVHSVYNSFPHAAPNLFIH